MKVIIIARNFTNTDGENSKPLVMNEIEGSPILLRIMRDCADSGFCDFVIVTDEKDNTVTRWLDITCLELFEKWRIRTVKTPTKIKSCGCIKYVSEYIEDEPFFYIDTKMWQRIDLKSLLEYHRSGEYLATLIAQEQDNGDIRSVGIAVFESEIQDYIKSSYLPICKGAIERIAEDGELGFYISNRILNKV